MVKVCLGAEFLRKFTTLRCTIFRKFANFAICAQFARRFTFSR